MKLGRLMLLSAAMLLANFVVASEQFETRMREGVAALEKNELTQAQASFEQASRLDPKNPWAWLLLAQTHARQKQREPAISAAETAETLGAAEPKILQQLANFYYGLLPDLPRSASLGARYAEKSPQDTTAWRRVGQVYLEAGLPDQAIQAATKGLGKDQSAELHTVLGSAYVQRKEWDKAAAELAEAVKINPYDEDAHFRLAQVYLLRQDFPAAVSALAGAKKIFARSAQIELTLGVAYYGLRKFPEAVEQFLKTMNLAPDVPQPYVFLGRILEHAHDRLPELIQRFSYFQARNPKSHLGYLLHAKALVAQLGPAGSPPEAQTAFELLEKSVSLKDDDAEAHYLLGVLLDRKREYKDAAAHLERSIQLNPKASAAHFRLARVYNRLGRTEDAERQRKLHEKLSEEENAVGPPAIAVDSPRPPAAGQAK